MTATKKPSAAELRAQESQAWRDFWLSQVPKFERLLEILGAGNTRPERLVGAVLDGAPALVKELQALLGKLQPELPPLEYVHELCHLCEKYAVKKITVGAIVIEWPEGSKTGRSS